MADKTGNSNLQGAKRAKNDEFYTQFHDIEKEINAYLEYDPNVFRGKTILLPCDDPEWSNFTIYFAQNFQTFGIKKLISTSFAVESKNIVQNWQPTLFETENPNYKLDKTRIKGKIFTLTQDINKDGKIDFEDLEWDYMQGDGDFRSEEVKKLRDEADFIITNPPFSLFREFLSWIVEAEKQFVIIGNKNAITYKEVFPLIKENKMWVGTTSFNKDMLFISPEKIDPENKPSTATRIIDDEVFLRSPSVWFTNLEHGRRHEPLPLMTMADNKRFNKKVIKSETAYQKYDNYDAIEVPFTNAIPSDYEEVMGVPISFLDKYNPEQFSIIGLGISNSGIEVGVKPYKPEHKKYRKEVQKRGAVDGDLYLMVNDIVTVPYARILIQHKNQ